jgi:uncharacterized protein (TIGR00730 family)
VRRVCVFCGASSGRAAAYASSAREFGGTLAGRGLGVVYGGGKVGLMGAVADGALSAGGEVVGVIPQALVERELAHDGLTELHVVGSLHERKALMAELADAFVALPGGFGTMDELFEALTLIQTGKVRHFPVVLVGSAYWAGLIDWIKDRLAGDGKIATADLDLICVTDDPLEVRERLMSAAHRQARASVRTAS